MTEALSITTSERDDNQLNLAIQLGPERTSQALQRGARLIAKRARIPGFRPGKAPYKTVLSMFGRDALLSEVLDDLGTEVYKEALDIQELEPFAQAALQDVEMEPLTFKLVVPLSPLVDLGEYSSIRVEIEDESVAEADVDERIESLRTQHATWEVVERPAELGDTVVMDIQGSVGEDPIMDNQDWALVLKGESGWLPGFDAAFVGMSTGEEKEFSLAYPEDSSSRYRGQEANFHATVKIIKARVSPELTDEFAKSVGEYDDVAAMRAAILADLTQHQEANALQRLSDAAVNALIEHSTLSYPPVALEETIQEMLRSLERQVSSGGYRLEDFLRLQGMTIERYREILRPQAEHRLKSQLVISQLRKEEKIEVTSEEIEAEIDRMTHDVTDEAERTAIRQVFGGESGKPVLEDRLLGEKTLARLRQIVKGEAPAPAPVADGEGSEQETVVEAPETAHEQGDQEPSGTEEPA